MQFWIIQTLNSLSLGGLLFLLSSGFSLIFGLMRIANLTHGALFMLGAYVGVAILKYVPNLWLAALLGGIVVAVFGGLLERLILRALAGNTLGQVLVTLGFAFIIADFASSSGAATRSRCRRPKRCGGRSSSPASRFPPIAWS
jgi:branched-chain amino acid transport system permease protein